MYNLYFFKREGNITVSYAGFYKRGYGHGPVGAAPGPFDTAKFLWYNSSMPEMARALKVGFGGVVDQLIVNSGLHGLPEFSGTVASALAQLQPLKMLLPAGRLPIWATTTLAMDDSALKSLKPRAVAELGPGYQAARDLGWGVLDRNGMVRSLANATASAGLSPVLGWSDRVHFKNFVSTEFNNVLLNTICHVLSSA